MSDGIDDLRIADVATFLAAYRAASITIAARQLSVTPSQVSKAIARLEGFLKVRLFARNGRGIAPTDQAKAMRMDMEELVRLAQELPGTRRGASRLALAAPSYLAMGFFGHLAARLSEVRLQAIEAGPATVRAYAEEGVIDMALTLSKDKFPSGWASTRIGDMHTALYGCPDLAKTLGDDPPLETLKATPFVIPIYHSGGVFIAGEDNCPIPRSERVHGHDAATIAVAVEIAAACNQLVYGPEVAVRRLVLDGRLVEIKADGFRKRVELYLHVNAEQVLARIQRDTMKILTDVLADGDSLTK
jgi:DNA-binding transcriptional LysR family regulator